MGRRSAFYGTPTEAETVSYGEKWLFMELGSRCRDGICKIRKSEIFTARRSRVRSPPLPGCINILLSPRFFALLAHTTRSLFLLMADKALFVMSKHVHPSEISAAYRNPSLDRDPATRYVRPVLAAPGE